MAKDEWVDVPAGGAPPAADGWVDVPNKEVQWVDVPQHAPRAFIDRFVPDDDAATFTELNKTIGNTVAGRIAAAAFEGASAGFGEHPLGISPEDSKKLQKLGIFQDPDKPMPLVSGIQFVNEAVMRPAVAAIAGVFRGMNAGIYGVGALAGQVASEALGEDAADQARARRDGAQFAAIATLLGMAHPVARYERGPTGDVRTTTIGGLPKAEDFATAAHVVGDVDAPFYVQEKMLTTYKEKGIHPAELANDAQTDPIVAQRLLSSDKDVLPGSETIIDINGQRTVLKDGKVVEDGGGGGGKEPPKPPEPPEPGSFGEAQKKILDKISVGERAPKERLTWDKFYTQAVDNLHPLKAVDEGAYELARLTRGQFGKAEHFIEHGTFDFNTYKTNGKSLKEIIEPMSKGNYSLDGFRAYLASKRALEIEGVPEKPITVKLIEDKVVGSKSVDVTYGDPKNAQGQIFGQVQGDTIKVKISTLGEESRGKGIGIAMYEQLLGFARKNGLKVASDSEVSAAAARVYDALERRGYTVERNKNVKVEANGTIIADKGSVFKVSGSSKEKPRKSGLDMEAAMRVADEGEGAYGKAATELVEYQNKTLKYLKDSGVLSEEAFGAMVEAGKNYVPFYRVITPEEGGVASKGFGPGNPVKRLKGSERDVIDPLESIIKNTYAYISVAERNAVGIKLIDALKKDGAEVKVSKRAPSDPELVNYLKEHGVTEPEALVDFVKTAVPEDGTTLGAFRDGVKETVEVNDPALVKAFRGLDQESAIMLTKVLAAPAKALRTGATLSPDFMVRNIVRDFMTAFVNSKGALFTPIDTAKGLISVIRKDADFQDWLKGGGANSTMVAMDRAYLQESLTKLAGETGLMSRSWNVVTSPYRGLRMISELAENATRLGEFKKLAGEDKASIQTAAFGSREVTLDFARIGASMRAYNMITAFGNAQIQGLDRIGRAFVDAPVNTTAKVAGGITLPSVLLWWANHDDPRYKELPHWQRDMFWIVMTKNHIYRIPKPFELGVVFGSGVERILDSTIGNNPEAFDKFSKSVFDIITPNVTPTAFQPLVEQYANRSTMNDRTLIPKDQEKNLPEYQYTPYTTELTKKLGQVISAFPGMREAATGPGAPFGPAARAVTTPILMENYIRAWTGGLGTYVLQAADAGLRKTGALPDPIKPASTLADIPVVKAFVVRYPSASAQSIQDFYDQHEVTKKFYDTWLGKAQDGDVDAMTRIQAAGGPMMFMRLDAIKETLTEHSKLVRDINKNQSIKSEEKRQLIDSLYGNMIEIGKAGKQMLRDSEKALKAAP